MSECKAYRREIEEAADGGALSPRARAHASTCCAGEVRGHESLRALVGGLGRVEAPADFEFRLRARMAAAKADGERGRFGGRWLYGLAPVAVAACFVVVSATLYFRQAARPTTNTVAPTVAVVPPQNAEPGRASSTNNEQNGPADSMVAGGQLTKASQTDVAPTKPQKFVRQPGARGRQSREVAFKSERRANDAQQTAIFSGTGAPVITGIPVKASSEPLRVILRDERGAERVVPMRSVSFGSQDLLSRGAAAKPSAVTEVGGVW